MSLAKLIELDKPENLPESKHRLFKLKNTSNATDNNQDESIVGRDLCRGRDQLNTKIVSNESIVHKLDPTCDFFISIKIDTLNYMGKDSTAIYVLDVTKKIHS